VAPVGVRGIRMSIALRRALPLLGLVLLTGPARGQDGDAAADAATARARAEDPLLRGSRGLQDLARLLSARERALDRRARTMDQREADLQALLQRIEEERAALEEIHDALEALLDEAEGQQDARLEGLVTMTDKMRDKQAAAMLIEMDPDLAVRVLDRMNRTKAGKALAKMPPAQAAALGERMTRPIRLPGGAL